MSDLQINDSYRTGINMFDVAESDSPFTPGPEDEIEITSDDFWDVDTNELGYSHYWRGDKFYHRDFYSFPDNDTVRIEKEYIDNSGFDHILQWLDLNLEFPRNGTAADNPDWFEDVLHGRDTIKGNKYSDTLLAGYGNDIVNGNGGKDRLYGQDGNDRLYGKSGADNLFGSDGNDSLSGGSSRDSLSGGSGKDQLSGGTNADRFIFKNVTDSNFGKAHDVIADFKQGTDKIDIHSIDADITRQGDQPFDFIGRAAYSDSPGEVRCEDGMVKGDVDGDGHSDFQIELAGISGLHTIDFVL